MATNFFMARKQSNVIWYKDNKGKSAYYEHPIGGSVGGLYINGVPVKKVDSSVQESEVLALLRFHGIRLDEGWRSEEEVGGEHLNIAVYNSSFDGAVHVNGKVIVQFLSELGDLEVFYNGKEVYRGRGYSQRMLLMLKELGVCLEKGWLSAQQNYR